MDTPEGLLVLASSSPQRTRLLTQAGIAHEVMPVDCHEDLDRDEAAETMVERVTRAKMAAALLHLPLEVVSTRPVLCADTLVSFEHHRLGKPATRDEADRFLQLLSGRAHQVLTGVVLWQPDAPGMRRAASAGAPARNPGASPTERHVPGRPDGPELAGTLTYLCSESHVRFFVLGVETRTWYLDSGEWEGAAGGYRIQGKGACLVEEVRGSYPGIVGLPIELIHPLMN